MASPTKSTAFKSIFGGGQLPLRVSATTGKPRRSRLATHSAPVLPLAPRTAIGAADGVDDAHVMGVVVVEAPIIVAPLIKASRRFMLLLLTFEMERAAASSCDAANNSSAAKTEERDFMVEEWSEECMMYVPMYVSIYGSGVFSLL